MLWINSSVSSMIRSLQWSSLSTRRNISRLILVSNWGHPGVKQAQALGRVYTISPHQGECFYLRLLLHNLKGPQLFADLRTVNGELCSSFREACLKLGLLEDDNQYHLAMKEATVSNSPASL